MLAKPSFRSVLRALQAVAFTVIFTVQTYADTQANVVSVEPSNSTTFAANEPFYVRVKYSTNEPVNLWVHPYYRGKPVKGVVTSASSKYVGEGEIVSWFALSEPGKVDEIRVVAGGGEPWRQWQVSAQRLELQWTAVSSDPALAKFDR